MKCLSKKLFCYLLVGFLSFGCVSTSYYRTVHAMEWAGGALAFEEALKWLLAAIGITATAGATDAFWQSHGDDFVQKCEQDGITQSEVASWQLKACEGIIDKTSSCWESFKEWALSLINNSGGSEGSGIPSGSPQSVYNMFCNHYNVSPVVTNFNSLSSYSCYGGFASYQDGSLHVTLLLSEKHYEYRYTNFSYVYTTDSSNFSYVDIYSYISSVTINNRVGFSLGTTGTSWQIEDSPYTDLFFDSNTGENDFQSVQNITYNIDIINNTGEDSEEEVRIKMPGLADSDDEVSSSAYDDIIDAINDGTINIDGAIEDIQGILGVIAYDTVTDDVIPNKPDPDTGGNKKKEDVIKENKNNMTFTLAGLENIFPFCIPFDIYAFITILEAEPDAPEFDFPIKSVNNQTENIHVDLSPFEPVAVVVRYIFDFLFIIGLAMLTRSLIGAGGSD